MMHVQDRQLACFLFIRNGLRYTTTIQYISIINREQNSASNEATHNTHIYHIIQGTHAAATKSAESDSHDIYDWPRPILWIQKKGGIVHM